MTEMTITEARQQAGQAGRGKLSSLSGLLRALATGEVYDTYAGNPTSNLTPVAKGSWCLDTTNNIWYRSKSTTDTDWVAIGTHGLTAAELGYLNGLTIGTGLASKALVLDSNGRVTMPSDLATLAGTGITGGTNTIAKSFVQKIGGVFLTTILIDLTGLASEATLADIIGDDGIAACHLGQITAAVNGTIFGGRVTCLEVPATGEVDIDFYSATVSTGVEGALITALTETALLLPGVNWTLGLSRVLSGIPPANDYIYMSVGTASTPTAGVYTAGKFLIEMFGT